MGDTGLKRHSPESRFAELLGGSADFTCLTAVYAIRTYGGVGGPLSDGGPIPIKSLYSFLPAFWISLSMK